MVRNTYDKEQDTFRVLFLIVPCAVLALLINQERSTLEVRGYRLTHKPFNAYCVSLTLMHCPCSLLEWPGCTRAVSSRTQKDSEL